ncbi:hypothetical protein FGO68_gene16554 [Halteria grandinella]|uniref:Uncharacterized protein n=1 Tax=Halteria grandinella TaxID=5974 RepID=A0A8J8NM40_HALGN|nr:hypothetical protein FGO68_gene16554 [Halteria grandinella]
MIIYKFCSWSFKVDSKLKASLTSARILDRMQLIDVVLVAGNETTRTQPTLIYFKTLILQQLTMALRQNG